MGWRQISCQKNYNLSCCFIMQTKRRPATDRPFSMSMKGWRSKAPLSEQQFYNTTSKFNLTSRSFWQKNSTGRSWRPGRPRPQTMSSGVRRKKNERLPEYQQRIKKYKEHRNELQGSNIPVAHVKTDQKDEVENLDRWLYNNQNNTSKQAIPSLLNTLKLLNLHLLERECQ